ncbi:MAG: carbohydrate porin [bacterium]
MKKRYLFLPAVMGLALTAVTASAGFADGSISSSGSTSPFSSLEASAQQWWNGKSALNNWFGLGYPLADHGLSITGEVKEGYYGLVSGGLPNQNRSNWAGEVKLKGIVDFEKLAGIQGLTFESNWRYRQIDGGTDATYTGFTAGTIGNSSGFNPNHMSSGLGMRILTQFFQWQNEKGKDPRFMIKLGWVNPYNDFLQQPLSKMFENNMIESNKGIGGGNGAGISVYNPTTKKYVNYGTSGVPWSSSFATWGGSLRAKPSATTYMQSGLYMAYSGSGGTQNGVYSATDVYPYKNTSSQYKGTQKYSYQTVNTVKANGTQGTPAKGGYVSPAQNNHGFNFQGAPTFQANGQGGAYSQNGLYNVNEFGWTPKLGADKLEGKYAIGGYIWGLDNTSYSSTTWVKAQTKPIAQQQNGLSWGLYLQADQRLYANKETAPGAPSLGKNPVDSKNPTPVAASTASKTRGLYSFSMFNFTPAENNALPFYFQTGLVYKGLLDIRKEDQMGVVLGAGFYSSYLNDYIDSQNQALKSAYNGHNATAANTVPDGPGTYKTTTTAKNSKGKTVTTTKTTQFYEYAPHFTSTEVVEAFYNIQINKWASLKPYAQWIVNPAGNGTVQNDLVMGASVKVLF